MIIKIFASLYKKVKLKKKCLQLCNNNAFIYRTRLYVIIMSRTCFRVNPHSIVA